MHIIVNLSLFEFIGAWKNVPGKTPMENCPQENFPSEISPLRISSPKTYPQESYSRKVAPGICPPRKIFAQIIAHEKLIYWFLLLLISSYCCNFMQVHFQGFYIHQLQRRIQKPHSICNGSPCDMDGFLQLTNVTKNFILDVAGVVCLSLSLIGELFPRCLSVRRTGQLMTHDETVRVARSVLCKTISRKDNF